MLRGDNLHLVTHFQLGVEACEFLIDVCPDAVVSEFAMYSVSEIEYGGTFREGDFITFRGEDKNLVAEEVELEVIDKFESIKVILIRLFHKVFHYAHPEVEAAFLRSVLVAVSPIGREPVFCDVVHSFCTNLCLNPIASLPHEDSVDRGIAVGLGERHPVAQFLAVRIIEICEYGVSLPAPHLLLILGAVDDNP